MNETVTESALARWLEPASIDLTEERLAALRDVVAELASDLAGHELDAVHAAHGQLSDAARSWAGDVLGERAPTVRSQDSTELLKRLLGAAVMERIDNSDTGLRCALAIGSAQFLGLTPLVDELPARAVEELAAAGRSQRERPHIDEEAICGALGTLPGLRKPNEETGEGVPVEDVAYDVAAHAKALRSVASAVDGALGALVERQDALDEEVEMLWWALRGTDDNGLAFEHLPPPVRAVTAAGELADRTAIVPGPPSASFLLGRVLGDGEGEEVALADLAGSMSQHLGPLGVSPHTLLGLSSAAAEQRRLGADNGDQTWENVVERTLAIDLSAKTTLAAGAQQVYRELQLVRLLQADE